MQDHFVVAGKHGLLLLEADFVELVSDQVLEFVAGDRWTAVLCIEMIQKL